MFLWYGREDNYYYLGHKTEEAYSIGLTDAVDTVFIFRYV